MTKAFPDFLIGLQEEPPGYQAEASVHSPLLGEAVLLSREQTEGLQREYYRLPVHEMEVTVYREQTPGCLVQRQHTVVKNIGTKARRLNAVSSAFVTGIGTGGSLPWYHPKRFLLHYCLQAWEGEGQWRTTTLAEQNLLPVSCHPVAAAIHFGETSSWTTCRYYPMVVLEDRELKKSWFVQLEEGAGWHIEIAHLGDPYKGELCLLADNFSERFGGGKRITLAAGESYTSTKAAFGCCDGGFEEAVAQLTVYRRAYLRRLPANGVSPLAFNDYMNCLWGDPTTERLLPLIEAAAYAGAEYFCIDAGWFTNRSDGWSTGLGDWIPSSDRFEPEGFSGILKAIREKGMKPGVWMQLESVGPGSHIYQTVPGSWLLRQEGEVAGGGARRFWDYQNPEVQDYFLEKIGKLYEMGVRYIKNDYNESFAAADNHTKNPVESVQMALEAFGKFLDRIGALYPDLILENCGSGAMRSDYGILGHCHVQSISDQEYYDKMPSILMGSLAQMLPEQVSCWCYPCPVLFDDNGKEPHEFRPEWADGEETVFNMVTALCATPLLSGRIDLADRKNLELIREAMTLYKSRRDFIAEAHPVFPLGMWRIEEEEGFACLGLKGPGALQLAVWRFAGEESTIWIPLRNGGKDMARVPQEQGTGRSVRQIYPANGYDTEAFIENGGLVVRMEKEYTARLFEITEE